MPQYPEPEPHYQRWLAAARKGESEPLGNVFAHFRAELLRVAASKLAGILQPKSEAADLVQDTFVEAQIGFLRFLGLTEEATFHWLKRILKNNIADLNRRFNATKRAVAHEQQLNTTRLNILVDDEPTPRTEVSNRERSGEVHMAVARLPKEYQDVVIMREVEQLRFAEIAMRMKKPTADAARKQYDRACKMLQDLLSKLDDSGRP
jgi:RNA polymerase sigma-70 factor (ECF subfamily)